MEHAPDQYSARYEVEYPEQLDRLSTLLRIPFAVPILLVASLMPIAPALIVSLAVEGTIDADSWSYGAAGAFFLPLVLMIVFRRKYPRWWFNFVLEFTRFEARIFAYVSLLTDQYPSTDAGQTVRLDLDYPDAEQLNRFLPIVKWLLLIPTTSCWWCSRSSLSWPSSWPGSRFWRAATIRVRCSITSSA